MSVFLTIVLPILGVIVGGLGALAGFAQWRKQRQVNRDANQLAAIEAGRRHAELTPQFELTCRRVAHSSDRVKLRITFVGPVGLDHLDGVEVAIRNDRPGRADSLLAGGPSAEQVAAIIWGPYRFVPGVDRADRLGRVTPPVALNRGETIVRELEPSLVPPWSGDPQWWRQQYMDTPIRLTITCTRVNDKPWMIPLEFKVEPELAP